MKAKVWFHAQIRWAVLDDKRGLRSWEESAYIFMSQDHNAAFQKALAEGRRCENYRKEGRRVIATRLAGIVSLDCYGASPSKFPLSPISSRKAIDCVPFEHTFDPDSTFPPPSF